MSPGFGEHSCLKGIHEEQQREMLDAVWTLCTHTVLTLTHMSIHAHIKINVKRMFKIEKSRLKDLLRVIKSVRIDSTCILYL